MAVELARQLKEIRDAALCSSRAELRFAFSMVADVLVDTFDSENQALRIDRRGDRRLPWDRELPVLGSRRALLRAVRAAADAELRRDIAIPRIRCSKCCDGECVYLYRVESRSPALSAHR